VTQLKFNAERILRFLREVKPEKFQKRNGSLNNT